MLQSSSSLSSSDVAPVPIEHPVCFVVYSPWYRAPLLVLKISNTSPLSALFSHDKLKLPAPVSEMVFVWRGIALDPNKTPSYYKMAADDRSKVYLVFAAEQYKAHAIQKTVPPTVAEYNETVRRDFGALCEEEAADEVSERNKIVESEVSTRALLVRHHAPRACFSSSHQQQHPPQSFLPPLNSSPATNDKQQRPPYNPDEDDWDAEFAAPTVVSSGAAAFLVQELRGVQEMEAMFREKLAGSEVAQRMSCLQLELEASFDAQARTSRRLKREREQQRDKADEERRLRQQQQQEAVMLKEMSSAPQASSSSSSAPMMDVSSVMELLQQGSKEHTNNKQPTSPDLLHILSPTSVASQASSSIDVIAELDALTKDDDVVGDDDRKVGDGVTASNNNSSRDDDDDDDKGGGDGVGAAHNEDLERRRAELAAALSGGRSTVF